MRLDVHVLRLRHFRARLCRQAGVHRLACAVRAATRGRRRNGNRHAVTMPGHFTLCIVVLVLLAVLGLPIGLSMIAASVFYFVVSGLDLGTAAEQILNGLFNSYVLLAVPLFILAADLMNTRQPDRSPAPVLPRAGRALPRRPRPRQRRRQHHLCRHVGLGDRRRRRHRPGHHRHDDPRRQLSGRLRGARSPRPPRSSDRSFLRRSRWSSTRSCPTRRSATSSSVA